MASGTTYLHGLRHRCGYWPGAKGKKERGTVICFGLGPDFASVLSNDSLNGRQANACALEIFLAMKALEDTKKLIGILGIKTHAIVADKNRGEASGIARANLNHSGLASAGEFQGIAKQIIEDQLEQSGVAINLR
jgi:hypothetical protein